MCAAQINNKLASNTAVGVGVGVSLSIIVIIIVVVVVVVVLAKKKKKDGKVQPEDSSEEENIALKDDSGDVIATADANSADGPQTRSDLDDVDIKSK